MKAVRILFALAAVFVTSAIVSAPVVEFTGWDPGWVQGAIAATSFLSLVPHGAIGVMSSVDIAAFKTEFGNYYQPRGQNAARLKKLLMHDTRAFDSQFTLMPMDGDMLETGFMSHGRVLQSFKPKWSPLGQLQGSPRKVALRRVKVNVEEIPDYLVNTWLGFLTTEGGKDPDVNRANWPFVRWYVEKYLIPQAKEDQFFEAYYGVWADPGTDATPSLEGKALDGIAMQVNTDIDAGNIVPINTGAFDADPELFVDQVEDFVEQIDNRYRGLPLVLNMHDEYAQRFKQGMLDKYNVNYSQVGDGNLMQLRKRTNVSVLGHINWLQGVGGAPSEKIISSPAGNLLKAVRTGNKEEGALRIEQVDYTLKMFNDWHILYTYDDPRIVYTNDRELTYGI